MSDVTVVVKTKGADKAAKDIKDVGDAAEKSHGPVGKLGGALGDVGKIAGGFVIGEGITKMGGFLMDAAKAAAEDEQSTARLSATIKSLGGDFQAQNALVQAAIKHGQDLAFTDDDVRDSFDKLAQATGSTEEALARQAVAMDLARGANIPLADASKLLGKVTDENLQVFKRMGITLPDVANEADVLAAVQAKFAGQSDAYAKSTAGQFEQAGIRMSELKESIGAQLLPVMTKLGDVLVTEVIPKLEQFAGWWATSVQPKIEAFFAWAQPKFEAFVAYVGVQFAKFQEFYASDIQPALDNIVAGVTVMVEQFKAHWSEIEPFVRPLFIMIETAMNALQSTIKIILDVIAGDWDGAWQGIKDLVAGIFDGIIALGDAFKDQIIAVFSGISDGVKNLAGAMYDAGVRFIQSFWDGLQNKWSEVSSWISDKLNPRNWNIPGFSPLPAAMMEGGAEAGGLFASYFYNELTNTWDQIVAPAIAAKVDTAMSWIREAFGSTGFSGPEWQTISNGGDTAANPGWNVLSPGGMINQYIGGGQWGLRPYNPGGTGYGMTTQSILSAIWAGAPGTQSLDPSMPGYMPSAIDNRVPDYITVRLNNEVLLHAVREESYRAM